MNFGDKDFNMKSYRFNRINFLNNTVDLFIAISKAIKEEYEMKGIDKNKIRVVYNGINPEGIVEKVYSNKKQNFNIIIAGSICEGKGQIQALQAINNIEYNDRKFMHLDIIGDGLTEYMNYLKKYVYKNNLNEIVSFKKYDNCLKEKFCNYDVGLVCSRAEGFGRITVEYMLAKVPVIVSNTGANSEIIDNEVNGVIYKYNDIYDLSKKIIYLYKNRDILEQYGKNAKEKAKNNFISDINIKNIYRLYQKLKNN